MDAETEYIKQTIKTLNEADIDGNGYCAIKAVDVGDAAYLIESLSAELSESRRRERAAIELLIKMGYCSQKVGAECDYVCDECSPEDCPDCIRKWTLDDPTPSATGEDNADDTGGKE